MSCFVGPTDETRRDFGRNNSWVGLSRDEKLLLRRFLVGLEVVPDELHTHIAVGMGDVELPDAGDRVGYKLMSSLWPRRIDAALRFGDEWWLIECKLGAAHYVLGQCLCYAFWWVRDCPECALARVVVVADRCHDDVSCVLCACGICVVEVGEVEIGSGY